jgi:hypothetical protein
MANSMNKQERPRITTTTTKGAAGPSAAAATIRTEIYVSGSTSVATVLRHVTEVINELAFPKLTRAATPTTTMVMTADGNKPNQQPPPLLPTRVPKYISLRGLGQGIDRAVIAAVRLQHHGFLVSFHKGTVSILEQPVAAAGVNHEQQQDKSPIQLPKNANKIKELETTTTATATSAIGGPALGDARMEIRQVPSIEIRIYVAQYLSGPHRPGYRPRWRIS